MMVRRVATVIEARARHDGLLALDVDLDGARAPAIAYPGLVGPVLANDEVLLNTTAVELGLGTGGVHLVIAVLSRAAAPEAAAGHAMKLRYTPMQTSVDAVEETHAALIDAVDTLAGMPVIAAGLHSALAPAAIGVRAFAPGARIAYVMTDGAALMMAFSDTVPALLAAGLIDTTITAGQALGGEREAVTLYGALAAAKAVASADIAIVSMGPGNLGTGTRWGFALMEVGTTVNVAAAMGARPIVVPRISFADARPRHQGVSHHTITVLERAALAPAEIALPALQPDRAERVRAQLAGALARHTVIDVDLGPAEDALRASPVRLSSMGRGFADDPDCFRAAAAAGVRAAQVLGEQGRTT